MFMELRGGELSDNESNNSINIFIYKNKEILKGKH